LFYHLQKKSRFNEDLVKFYAAEIYLTLQYLHSKKILYRDLKPENLILDKSGHLKLIDFGLSISDISEKNLANGFCGTMEYLPPELLLDQDYGFSFDWWGFGVLIYEMFHGYPPFSDNNRKTLFNKILHKRVEFGNVNMSPEAKDLIQKLLNKNIDKRIKPSDIKNHPWFRDMNFEKLLDMKVEPPFKPKVNNDEDLSNIDKCFLNSNINSPPKAKSFKETQLLKELELDLIEI